MINEVLEFSKINKELLGITLHGESEFWCGIVEDYSEEFIQLRHYTKYGELDGVAIEKISNIERIDITDDYIKALKIVIEQKEKIKDIEIKSRIFDDLNSENWQYISLKPFENDNYVLTSIQINSDNFYTGFVKDIDEEYIKFEIVGNAGNSEGISLFKLENISSIKINDLECRRKLLIYKSKNPS